MSREPTAEEWTYSVRCPWEWVLAAAFPSVAAVQVRQLYTMRALGEGCSLRRTTLQARPVRTATMRFETKERATGALHAAWCCSALFEPVRNKDLLVATLRACGLDWVAPPSLLLPWPDERVDGTDTDLRCMALPGVADDDAAFADVPPPPRFRASDRLPGGEQQRSFLDGRYVLKPPMGCQGEGIEFLSSVQSAAGYLDKDYELAQQHQTDKYVGRRPHYVLQAHIAGLLIAGGRKFHLRTHLLLVESRCCAVRPPSGFRLYYHDRHEVRIASCPDVDDYAVRGAHITNGAGGSATQRRLLSDVPELRGLDAVLASWLARFLGALAARLLDFTPLTPAPPALATAVASLTWTSWALAALDIMLDEAGRLWLLEINRAPAAPGRENIDDNVAFQQHLIAMAQEIRQLVLFDQPGSAFHQLADVQQSSDEQ